MGIETAIDLRPSDWEYSYRYGGNHTITAVGTWQTALDLTASKRGTMYLRHSGNQGANWDVKLRVTIDGVAEIIQDGSRGCGLDAWWIFDFNKSVKIEHYHSAATGVSRVEWAQYQYDKDGSCP